MGSSKGRIAEYLDNGKFLCAVVLDEAGNRLRLLNQNGRELSLARNRVIHLSRTALPADGGRQAWLRDLTAANTKRQELISEIDLQQIWELAVAEQYNTFEPDFLTELCFGSDVTDNQAAAFLRAIFIDRLYFKYKAGIITVHSEETVEQLRLKQEKDRQKEELLKRGAEVLKSIMHGKTHEQWPELDSCLEMLRQYYLFGNDVAGAKIARELLKKAELTRPHDIFHLLVKKGIWTDDENIPLLRRQIPADFPEEVLEHAASIVAADPEELIAAGRHDLRHLPAFTIDGESTRDYDDAIHLQREGDHYRVGIHIADVAHYVKPGDILFNECMKRGTSIYFPERTIPMLPACLSEDICSLIRDQEKPAMSFLVQLAGDGTVLDYKIMPSVIRVKRQLTYQQANELVETDQDIADLARLGEKLRQKRIDNDAVVLPFPDLIINPAGEGVDIRLEEANTPSRLLVAELMILANSLAARHLSNRETPGLFRSQPPPRQRLVHGLQTDIAILCQQRKRLSPMSLLSKPKPHSGIGVSEYTTVTSPIRRLLDLIMQHQIHASISNKGPLFLKRELNQFAATITDVVGRANSVRFLRQRYWVLKYLENKIGEHFEGILINNAPRRVHVVLPELLLDIDLPLNQAIRPEPGNRVTIRLARADALDNTLRFEWA